MTALVAVYTGESLTSLELVSATSDPDVVTQVARLIRASSTVEHDPVRRHLTEGRNRALDAVADRAQQGGRPNLVALPS